MKISILGAGWLGFPLGEKLVQSGFHVKGATTTEEKLATIKERGMIPFLINLNLNEALPSSFFQSDLLIITLPPGRRDPEVEINYRRRIRAVIEMLSDSSIQNLIYTSSIGVYGDQEGLLDEDSPVNPNTPSSKAVWQAEIDLKNTGLPVTICRLAGLVGGKRHPGRFLAGKKELPDGEAPVNLVHREDCIEIVHSIIQNGKWGEIYNVCADEHPIRSSFYTQKAIELGLQPPDFEMGQKTKAYKVISNEKVKRELGYEFRYPNPMEF